MLETVQTTTEDPTPDGGQPQTFDAEYVSKLRQEAKDYRLQLRDVQAQISELKPLAEKAQQLEQAQMTEVEKLTAQLAELKTAQDAAKQQAEAAAKQTALVKMAAQAGVKPDVLDLLNVDAFDLSNAEETIAKLQALAPKTTANGGTPSNPARSQGSGETTPEEWYKQITGRNNKASIFGG